MRAIGGVTTVVILTALSIQWSQALDVKDVQNFKVEPNPMLHRLSLADKPNLYEPGMPLVTAGTNRGKLLGFRFRSRRGNESVVFQGVPFAEPPINELRLALPKAKAPWNGTLHALRYKAACMQMRPSEKMPDTISEDCLYLNIFAPQDALTSNRKYPVIYYVFGGAFDFGSPRFVEAETLIDNFVSQGIIFVTTNYRVGGLAFFTTATDDAPGNLQLHDIIQGLRWTHEEITHFGGDPDRITIMGHSSGGMCIVHLTLTPLTEGLYSQAVVMSGPGLLRSATRDNSTWYEKTAAKVGCNPNDDWKNKRFDKIAACMRTKDAQDITNAYLASKEPGKSTAFREDGPGGVFPGSIFDLAVTRRPTPYLVGTVNNEAPMALRSAPQPTRAKIRAMCELAVDHYLDERIVEPCVHFYDVEQRERDEQHWDFFNQRLKQIDSDQGYVTPAFLDAAYMREAGGRVYLYNFDYIKHGLEEIANTHAMDLFYIFGTIDLGPMTPQDTAISRLYRTLFGNFVKYGNPTPVKPGINATKWEPLRGPTGFNYYRIDSQSEMREFYHFEPVQFWNEVVPYLIDSMAKS